jgi:hypothetical protein
VATCLLASAPGARAETQPAQEPPQKIAFPGELVRLAYNDEGYVTLGYRIANDSVGGEWMLLETGMTLNRGVPAVTITRDALSVQTPDGSMLPLATQQEFAEASAVLKPLDRRANRVRDSVDYLPRTATVPCRMSFFMDLSSRGRRPSRDEFELSSSTRCFGRIYFHVPGGIQYGQHILHVRLGETTVQVPFRIMTKEELKEAKAELKRLRKEAKKAKQGE